MDRTRSEVLARDVRPSFGYDVGSPSSFTRLTEACRRSHSSRVGRGASLDDGLGRFAGASRIVDERGFSRPIGRQGQSRLWDRREFTTWARKWRKEKPWR